MTIKFEIYKHYWSAKDWELALIPHIDIGWFQRLPSYKGGVFKIFFKVLLWTFVINFIKR